MAETLPGAGGEEDRQLAWWSLLRWIMDTLVGILPCKPVILPLLPSALRGRYHTSQSHHDLISSPGTATGTILCPREGADWKVRICLHADAGRASPPDLLLLELPIAASDLAGACRIALECDRARSGEGPLLSMPDWTVYCNGRKMGFGTRRPPTKAEVWALRTMQPVSAGAGVLPPPPHLSPPPEPESSPTHTSDGGAGVEVMRGGRFAYLRGTFQRVVGSADSESYHLLDPGGSFGQELSLFFLRV